VNSQPPATGNPALLIWGWDVVLACLGAQKYGGAPAVDRLMQLGKFGDAAQRAMQRCRDNGVIDRQDVPTRQGIALLIGALKQGWVERRLVEEVLPILRADLDEDEPS